MKISLERNILKGSRKSGVSCASQDAIMKRSAMKLVIIVLVNVAKKTRDKVGSRARKHAIYTIQSLYADSLALICDRNGEEVTAWRRDDVGLSPRRYERWTDLMWKRYFRKRCEKTTGRFYIPDRVNIYIYSASIINHSSTSLPHLLK